GRERGVPTPASLPRVQLIFLAALLLGVALALSRWLRTGRYRRPEETGPLPRHVWVVPAIPFGGDRKSTRLNSSHVSISYAVFYFTFPYVIYTLSLHVALPIWSRARSAHPR